MRAYPGVGKVICPKRDPSLPSGTAKTEEKRFIRERKKKGASSRFNVEPTFLRGPTLDFAPLGAEVGKRCHNLELGW